MGASDIPPADKGKVPKDVPLTPSTNESDDVEHRTISQDSLQDHGEKEINARTTHGRHWLILSGIISLCALGLSAYTIAKLYPFEYRTHQDLKTIKQTLSSLPISSLATNVKQLLGKEQEIQVRLNKTEQQTQALQEILKHPALMNNIWPLFKAKYCLELAQINEKWGADQQSTFALLTQAESFLTTMNSQAVISVRQAINQERKQLADRLTKAENLTTLLSQLESIQQNLFQLPLRRSVVNNEEMSTTERKAGQSQLQATSWQTQFRENMQALKKLVVVHHGAETIEPLLPMYQTLLQESIRLEIQQAQWALIHRDQVVYRLSVHQALELMRKTFDVNNATTRTIMERLESLQQIQLDISSEQLIHRSLELLNQVIGQKLPAHQEENNPDHLENPVKNQEAL